MAKLSIAEEIDSLIRRNRWAEFLRDCQVEMDTITGYALARSDSYVLIARTVDFHSDGFHVARIQDISEIDAGRKRDTINKIMVAEGVVSDAIMPFDVDMSCWRTVLDSIRRFRHIMLLDFEFDRNDPYLYIGTPTRLNSRSATFRWFNIHGVWEVEHLNLPYEEISSVRFDTEYMNVFSKYLKEPKTTRT